MTRATDRFSLGRASRRLFVVASALVFAASSCDRSDGGETTGGETHFLTYCEAQEDNECGKLSCLCSVCTIPCDADSACSGLPGAVCRVTADDECAVAHCEVECQRDQDCAVVSTEHRCVAGVCRAGVPSQGAGGVDGTGGTAGTGGMPPVGSEPSLGGAGGEASDDCAAGRVAGNEVVVLGDSFFASNPQTVLHLNNLARAEGVLGADEGFRNYTRITENGLAFGDQGIPEQYDAALADGRVSLVVMNGGGADMLAATCDPNDCSTWPEAASELTALFERMASEGVLAVVFAAYPDPVDPTLRARMDAFRPFLEESCRTSSVPCRWLDLRQTFEGRYAEYILPDGLNPTNNGATATAEAIWAELQDTCWAK